MTDSTPEELLLLREIARWAREAGLPHARERVERLVDTEGKLRVYAGMADGTASLMALERATGVNHNDIRRWVDAWEAEAIAEPGAKPPKATFSIAELGIAPPPAKPRRAGKDGVT